MSDAWNAGGMGSSPGWLDRILGYTNPPPDNPNDPDAAVRAQMSRALQAQLQSGAPPNLNVQPTLGPPNPIATVASIPTSAPYGGHSTNYGPPVPPPAPPPPYDPLSSIRAPTPPSIPIGGGPGMAMEAPTGVPSTLRARGTGGATISPTARANVPPAAASSPVGPDNTFQYIVPNSTASRAPIYTAGNFGNLFGGGRPNPADVPAASATPMSGGPLAKGSDFSKAPWDYGPQQKGKAFPSEMGPFTEGQRTARGLKQRYG